jgi:hypothetical protein
MDSPGWEPPRRFPLLSRGSGGDTARMSSNEAFGLFFPLIESIVKIIDIMLKISKKMTIFAAE